MQKVIFIVQAEENSIFFETCCNIWLFERALSNHRRNVLIIKKEYLRSKYSVYTKNNYWWLKLLITNEGIWFLLRLFLFGLILFLFNRWKFKDTYISHFDNTLWKETNVCNKRTLYMLYILRHKMTLGKYYICVFLTKPKYVYNLLELSLLTVYGLSLAH